MIKQIINNMKSFIKKIFQWINNKFGTELLFILGFLLVMWIIYNRLFRVRESLVIQFEFSVFKCILYAYLIAVNVMYLHLVILKFFIIFHVIDVAKLETKNPTLFQYIREKLSSFFGISNTALETFYKNGIRKLPYITLFYDQLCFVICKNNNRNLIVKIIPKFMMLCQ